MKNLEKNIKNLYGKVGTEWLDSLPGIIDKLSQLWSLTSLQPVNNMSWNFVALAMHKNNVPVVLKISCDKQLIQDEYQALKHFNGQGAIKAYEIHPEYNALLLQQAIPGYLLKEHRPQNIEDTISIYCQVVNELSTHKLAHKDYTHVSKWCEAIDRIKDSRIDQKFIRKAKQLRSFMLDSNQREYLCHGDLHLENIIQHENKWLAIDPKGIIGEMAFEVAAFDLITKDEMNNTSEIPSIIFDRVTKLATVSEVEFDRLLSWIFLRIIISAQWFVEDNGDPSQMLVLGNHVYKIISEK